MGMFVHDIYRTKETMERIVISHKPSLVHIPFPSAFVFAENEKIKCGGGARVGSDKAQRQDGTKTDKRPREKGRAAGREEEKGDKDKGSSVRVSGEREPSSTYSKAKVRSP